MRWPMIYRDFYCPRRLLWCGSSLLQVIGFVRGVVVIQVAAAPDPGDGVAKASRSHLRSQDPAIACLDVIDVAVRQGRDDKTIPGLKGAIQWHGGLLRHSGVGD